MTRQFKISPARTGEERNSVFRLRYQVYVEELKRYRSIADHESSLYQEEVR